MAFFDKLALKVVGNEVENAARVFRKTRFGFGYLGSSVLGAGIGGVVGLARGDNYDSTASLRNFTSGALGGAGLAFGLRAAIPRLPGAISHLTGMRHAMAAGAGSRLSAFRSAPLPSILESSGRAAAKIANGAMKVGGFLGRHPGLTAGAAVLGGAGIYMSGAGSSVEYSTFPGYEDQTDDTEVDSMREFHSSTQNLVQGLHRGRHR